jgi:hypothetical protein
VPQAAEYGPDLRRGHTGGQASLLRQEPWLRRSLRRPRGPLEPDRPAESILLLPRDTVHPEDEQQGLVVGSYVHPWPQQTKRRHRVSSRTSARSPRLLRVSIALAGKLHDHRTANCGHHNRKLQYARCLEARTSDLTNHCCAGLLLVDAQAIAQGASWDRDLVRRVSNATAIEARILSAQEYTSTKGANMGAALSCDGGPLANSAHDPRCAWSQPAPRPQPAS